MKAVCNVTHLIKCFNRLRSPLLLYSDRRFVHLSSLNNKALKLKEDRVNPKNRVFFTRHESQFYHRILEEDPKYSSSILKRSQFGELLASIPDLKIELDADLSNLSPPNVLPYTAMLTRKLLSEELDPASPELVQFASYIKRNVKTLLKDDIPKILSLVYLWPATNKLLHPSMNTIIFSLDHACLISVDTKKAPVQEVLLWMEPWHWLGLCTMSEFIQMATGKLFWNADKPEHIVQLLFYMGELRTLPQHYDRPSIEKKIVRYMKKFKPDEIGILAAGFYKSSTKVTNYVLYKQLVRRLVNDAAKFHDIPLNAVLKLMRGTILTFKEEEDVHAIYKALTPLVPTLSGMCLVQICMLGTPMEITDRDIMRTTLNILCNQKNGLREKDFQRVMYVCAIGLDEEDVRDFVKHTVAEMYRRKLPTLHHAEGAGDNREIYTKAISFIESVLFLHILGHRSSDLVASAIEMGNQLNVQPKGTIALYYLDTIVDLIFPNYSGPRLDETVREKHHSNWFPPRSNLYPSMTWFGYEWRETNSEMLRTFYLDVCDACGGNNNVACQSVLPLYAHRDLVVCTDNEGNFLSVPPEFGCEAPWRVKRPLNTDNRTFCVLMLLRDRSRKGQPDYTLYQRMRETLLRSLGYRIAVVRYKVFEDIPKADKCEYILETIKLAR